MRIQANHRTLCLGVTIPALCLSVGPAASANPQGTRSATTPYAAQIQADGPIHVRLDSTTARYFDTAFRAVSEQAHVFIVSEGTPLQASLTDEEVAELKDDRLFDSPVEVAEAVKRLAEAYDYFVEQPNPHTFLLSKKYTDPADLPCVTYAEITHSLKSVLQIVDAFAPDTDPPTYRTADQLFDSLSPEQATKAKTAIALTDLQPRQQVTALDTLISWTWGNQLGPIRQLARTLSVVSRPSTVFQWVDARRPDQSRAKAFGLQGEFGVGDALVGLPITFPFRPIGGQTWFSLPDHDAPANGDARDPDSTTPATPSVKLAASVDPSTPTGIDRRLAQGMLANRLPGTMTLRDAIQKATGSTTVDINEAIAGKPVNVFGTRYAGGTRPCLQALADVYGLQVIGDSDRRLSLALPESRLPGDPAQVSAQIKRLIPPPLARAYVRRTGTHTENEAYFSAIRRLIALVEPAVPTLTSPPVQVETEGLEAKRLIALALLTGEPLRQLLALETYAPPRALVYPDRLRMTLNRDTSGNYPCLNVSYGHLSDDGISYVIDGVYGSMTIPAGRSTSDRIH